jgi:UDP-3-O-[3-hydroxymyristoyl] N-acetylglucosamine deacetylase
VKIRMVLKPAPANFGVRFRRMDMHGRPTIIAHYHHVVDTLLATSIGFDGVVVSTVEHLMAALSGSGVDNLLVELDGPEVPIFDGSAARYVEVIEEAGLQEQEAYRQYLKVAKPLVVREGDAYIKASPSDRFQVRYAIDFPHPLVGKQELAWPFDSLTFGREIARARTFGFLRDVQKLQSMGLARGGSLANAIVFDDYGLLNHGGFRYSDECVRHKILDLVGDFSLAGVPLIGSFEAHKAGHALHNRFLKQLVAKAASYTVFSEPRVSSPFFRSPAIPGFAEPFPAALKPL